MTYNYTEIDLQVFTQAVAAAGWTKSVNVNPDGTIEWYGESDYPSEQQILQQIEVLVPGWKEEQESKEVISYQGQEE
tara:strand:+ start:2931 stop:3161 length:231 start_codon:yes stop_codon:yes gene_type:complete